MVFLGAGFDTNGDGNNDVFIGSGGRRVAVSACGKKIPHSEYARYKSLLNVPDSPCVILQCGFCNQPSLAFTSCPWCGAKDTWTEGLQCSRCKKRLGDNPCSKCGNVNAICNFHFLDNKPPDTHGCSAIILLSVLLPVGFLLSIKAGAYLFGHGPHDGDSIVPLLHMAFVLCGGFLFPVYLTGRLLGLGTPAQAATSSPIKATASKPKKVKAGKPQELYGDAVWLMLPSGEVRGPRDRTVVENYHQEGHYPEGTLWAARENGPWMNFVAAASAPTSKPAPPPVAAPQLLSFVDALCTNCGKENTVERGNIGTQLFCQHCQRNFRYQDEASHKANASLVSPADTNSPDDFTFAQHASSTIAQANAEKLWVRTPDGKRGGPYSKQQVTRAIAAGKLPTGSEAATSPDGPWKVIKNLQSPT
jgi:hypothetical protein